MSFSFVIASLLPTTRESNVFTSGPVWSGGLEGISLQSERGLPPNKGGSLSGRRTHLRTGDPLQYCHQVKWDTVHMSRSANTKSEDLEEYSCQGQSIQRMKWENVSMARSVNTKNKVGGCIHVKVSQYKE